ncbi:MAG: universal stress protein [Acidobacteriota bacterium]|nr:universal stress protein [Acidobacteriota bacterium]
MKHLKSILLYATETSGAEAALKRAEALAIKNEALLWVVDVLPGRNRTWSTMGGQPESRQAVVTARLRELDLLVAPACRRGVAVRVKVLIGRPSAELIREVLRNGHDLVVLNAGTEDGWPGPLFGRTDLHLLKDCPCPVWVNRQVDHGRHRRTLAALDAGEDWSERQQESLRVLEHSVSIAECDGSELRIVYYLGHWSSYNTPKIAKNALGHYRRRLDELLARCDLSRVRNDVRLERAAAVDVIAAHCEEIDVIVMGTVWRSGPAGVLIADTATDALARVDCSVLAVNPEGFITPVRLNGRSARSSGVTRWAA